MLLTLCVVLWGHVFTSKQLWSPDRVHQLDDVLCATHHVTVEMQTNFIFTRRSLSHTQHSSSTVWLWTWLPGVCTLCANGELPNNYYLLMMLMMFDDPLLSCHCLTAWCVRWCWWMLFKYFVLSRQSTQWWQAATLSAVIVNARGARALPNHHLTLCENDVCRVWSMFELAW